MAEFTDVDSQCPVIRVVDHHNVPQFTPYLYIYVPNHMGFQQRPHLAQLREFAAVQQYFWFGQIADDLSRIGNDRSAKNPIFPLADNFMLMLNFG